jgi:hypothetical protein
VGAPPQSVQATSRDSDVGADWGSRAPTCHTHKIGHYRQQSSSKMATLDDTISIREFAKLGNYEMGWAFRLCWTGTFAMS